MSTSKVIEGVFAVNKPQSITSAQALRNLQTRFDRSALFRPWLEAERAKNHAEPRTKSRLRRDRRRLHVKLGHGGTLDPLATGVLITGLGRGTKCLQRFLECTKTYEAVVLFGVATDTYDRLGKIVARNEFRHITKQMVEKALCKFRGKIMQRPPIFSALRIDGKRLYEYAREGKELPIEIKPRPVEVLEVDLLDWMDGGTHEHRWPEAEADIEDKLSAQKLMESDNLADESFEKCAPTEMPEDKTDLKRKRELHAIQSHDLKPSTATKRPKTSPELVMSGAMRSSEDPELNSTPKKDSTTSNPNDVIKEQVGAGVDVNDGTANTSMSRRCDAPAAKLRMTVTSGFYVRSLCHDLGTAVGSLGIMAELIRTRQGDFELGRNVVNFEEIEKGEDVWGPQIERSLEDWMEKEGWNERRS